MQLLEAQNLYLAVPPDGRCLVNDVSLSVDAGDRIGLAGETGSGKSSLLRVIAWLDSQATGTIRWRGEALAADEVPAFRRQVSLVAQQPVMTEGSVRQNLAMACSFQANSIEYRDHDAIHFFTQMGRSNAILEQDARRLSGGERQIVHIIRSMLLQPHVLLLDEPSASMDAETTLRLESMLLQWVDETPSRGFVWVSHDPNQLDRVSNRTWRLEDGQIH